MYFFISSNLQRSEIKIRKNVDEIENCDVEDNMGRLDLLPLLRLRKMEFSLICLGEIPINLTKNLDLKEQT